MIVGTYNLRYARAMPTAIAAPIPWPVGLLQWPSFGLGLLHRHAQSVLEQRLGTEGLSLRAYFVFACLAEEEGLSQQQVCDRAQVDRSDMVRLIDELERKDLVLRRRDVVDRRRNLLSLTRGGRKALRRADRILSEVTDEVFAALSANECRELHRLTLIALGQEPSIAAGKRRVPARSGHSVVHSAQRTS